MTNIVYRRVKGSPLTSSEIDNNFEILKNKTDQVYSDLTASDGASLVGFQQPGTGAVVRTVQDKLIEIGVTPEDFGGDIQAAGDYAATNGVPLVTLTKDYDLQNGFVMADNLVWYSLNTRLRMVRSGSGISSPLDSVLIPRNNTRIIGKLRTYMVDSPGAGVYRSHVLCGDYLSGSGISGFTFDTIEMEGGQANCNGFFVTGASKNIRGRSLTCGDTSVIGRVFLAHWGNAADHPRVANMQTHVPGWGQTTHPNNISIDQVESGSITTASGDFLAVVALSAAYDISIGKVSGSVHNSGAGGSDIVLLTAGDMGFAYASEDERAAGMWGIKIGSVHGSCSKIAVNRSGRALYADLDATPQPADYYLAKISEKVGSVSAKGGLTVLHGCVSGTNGGGYSVYDKIESDGFLSAVAIGNHDQGFRAGVVIARNNQKNALRVLGSGADVNLFPKNVTIGELVIDGTGAQFSAPPDGEGFFLQSARNILVERVIANSVRANSAIGVFRTGLTGARIGVIHAWPGYAHSYAVSNIDGASDVDIGHAVGPSTLVTPVNGGYTVRSMGRFREFSYYGGTVPAGIPVRVGDRFIATEPAVGQPWMSIVTTAGVTGSTAVVTGYLSR